MGYLSVVVERDGFEPSMQGYEPCSLPLAYLSSKILAIFNLFIKQRIFKRFYYVVGILYVNITLNSSGSALKFQCI